ncbi:MAG: hypothetical protein U1E70_17420 [Acetobacteraceae bacterium]
MQPPLPVAHDPHRVVATSGVFIPEAPTGVKPVGSTNSMADRVAAALPAPGVPSHALKVTRTAPVVSGCFKSLVTVRCPLFAAASSSRTGGSPGASCALPAGNSTASTSGRTMDGVGLRQMADAAAVSRALDQYEAGQ